MLGEWPEVEDLEECTEQRIEEIIDPPSLASNRESFYWVPAMRNEKYIWGRTIQFSEFQVICNTGKKPL